MKNKKIYNQAFTKQDVQSFLQKVSEKREEYLNAVSIYKNYIKKEDAIFVKAIKLYRNCIEATYKHNNPISNVYSASFNKGPHFKLARENAKMILNALKKEYGDKDVYLIKYFQEGEEISLLLHAVKAWNGVNPSYLENLKLKSIKPYIGKRHLLTKEKLTQLLTNEPENANLKEPAFSEKFVLNYSEVVKKHPEFGPRSHNDFEVMKTIQNEEREQG